MGANQSHQIPPKPKDPSFSSAPSSDENNNDEMPLYPDPSGNEYDAIDNIQAELPSIIDEESQQQVDDYKQACDNGKGPVRASVALGNQPTPAFVVCHAVILFACKVTNNKIGFQLNHHNSLHADVSRWWHAMPRENS
jgi:hypothetical protein